MFSWGELPEFPGMVAREKSEAQSRILHLEEKVLFLMARPRTGYGRAGSCLSIRNVLGDVHLC